MIVYLKGTALNTTDVLLNNIAYRVATPHPLTPDTEIELWCSHIYSDNGQRLYGFELEKDRDMFNQLISVNGIGGSTALAIIKAVGTDATLQAITTKQPEPLTQAKGVGKRGAERIITELHGKVEPPTPSNKNPQPAPGPHDTVRAALLKLGFTDTQADDAISHVAHTQPDSSDPQTLIRIALVHLGQL